MKTEDIHRLTDKAGWSGLLITWAEPTGEPDWTPAKARLTVPATAQQLERFIDLIVKAERERLADLIDRMPFGDTAASFAIWIRNQP